jgi:hypothetical protein
MCPNLLSSGTVIVVSDGVRCCRYIMSGHISPKAETVNMAVNNAFAGPLAT